MKQISNQILLTAIGLFNIIIGRDLFFMGAYWVGGFLVVVGLMAIFLGYKLVSSEKPKINTAPDNQ